MCHFDTNRFSGCGCVRRRPDAPLERCVVAEVYGRDCAEDQCGPHPERPAAECFGLVCMECLGGGRPGDDKGRKGKRTWRSSKR